MKNHVGDTYTEAASLWCKSGILDLAHMQPRDFHVALELFILLLNLFQHSVMWSE